MKHGWKWEKRTHVVIVNPEGKEILGKPMHKWEVK